MNTLDASREPDEAEPPILGWLRIGFDVYLRILAFIYLAFAILTWLSIVGYFDGAEMRFDTMSTPAKVGSAVLAVLHPVTAVGLWTTMIWGQVIWSMTVAFQLSMLGWYAGAFGLTAELIWFHLLCIAIYIGFQAGLRFIHKKE